MSLKALQDYTYYSRYAQYYAEKKRRETWLEAVDRVEGMHFRRYPQIREEIRWAFDQVRQKRVLGSQRALQFGGLPIERKNARIYNCIGSHCDRIRFFQETFWLLLCGAGTGFSVQTHHIAKLPEFHGHSPEDRPIKKFFIPDTIEGWADALGILLATYMPNPEFEDWHNCKVDFDYSLIRQKGAPLSSGVGKAPGSGPLSRSLEVIRTLLDRCIENGQTRLRSIDAYDIVMHSSDAVLSGGVRRSATICLFSPDDIEMATSKTGNWQNENPQRGRSNNSALLLRDSTSKEQFLNLIEHVKQFGEPGFVWSDDTELVVNPCVEIALYPVDEETGTTGWQACNLCEINGRKAKTREDFEIAAKAAAIIGTIQAGYTEFSYLGEISEKIIRKEALLGVSITGMMDNPDVLFDPKNQRDMAKIVIKTNEEIAAKIGINPASRCTCVKPAGTTSCILGTASGIHPHHGNLYFRRVQANTLEEPLKQFKKYNPFAVEPCVWSANQTDEVITFLIEVPKGAKTKNDLSAIELLECVKSTQKNWVQSGTIKERCTKPWLRHNVSNTIHVKPDEWDDVAAMIYKNRNHFAGIALLSATGDLDYRQAPNVKVHNPRELLQIYGDGTIFAHTLITEGVDVFGDLWTACDAVLGISPIESPEKPEIKDDVIDIRNHVEYQNAKQEFNNQIKWINNVTEFSLLYTEGDIKKCTYLMKEIHNWEKWLKLKSQYQEVDYTEMYEEEDNTILNETIACAGGACEII